MRTIIATFVALSVLLGSVASASADHLRHRNQDLNGVLGGAFVGIVTGIIVGGAIASMPQYHNNGRNGNQHYGRHQQPYNNGYQRPGHYPNDLQPQRRRTQEDRCYGRGGRPGWDRYGYFVCIH